MPLNTHYFHNNITQQIKNVQTKNNKTCDTTYVSTMRAYKLRTENWIEATKKDNPKLNRNSQTIERFIYFWSWKIKNRIIEQNKN